jgi:hypothetical protein
MKVQSICKLSRLCLSTRTMKVLLRFSSSASQLAHQPLTDSVKNNLRGIVDIEFLH